MGSPPPDTGFRSRYFRSVYPYARALGLLLIVAGLGLAAGLRVAGIEVETRSLMLVAQGALAGSGLLLLLSRYYLSPQLLQLGATLLLLTLGLEIGLRMQQSRLYVIDTLVEARHAPGRQASWNGRSGGREFDVAIAINSHGFADVERRRAKGDAFRVAMLGDSFVEAFQVPLQDNLSQRLEARLNQQHPGDFEVLNFGVSGYGTAQERFMLEHYALAYDPDLVVVLFVPQNDLMDNLRRYELVDDRIETMSASATVRKHRLRRLYPKSIELLHDGVDRLAGSFAVEAFHHQQASYYGVYRTGRDAEREQRWAIQRRAMEDLLRVAANRPVLFVAGACNEQVDPAAWEALRRAYPTLRAADHDLGRPNRRFMEICGRLDADCLDLLPAFRSHGGPRLHYAYDGHFNRLGHALAADRIHRKLIDAGLLPL